VLFYIYIIGVCIFPLPLVFLFCSSQNDSVGVPSNSVENPVVLTKGFQRVSRNLLADSVANLSQFLCKSSEGWTEWQHRLLCRHLAEYVKPLRLLHNLTHWLTLSNYVAMMRCKASWRGTWQSQDDILI